MIYLKEEMFFCQGDLQAYETLLRMQAAIYSFIVIWIYM